MERKRNVSPPIRGLRPENLNHTYLFHQLDWVNDVSEGLGDLLSIFGPPTMRKDSFWKGNISRH
jgi:hypothetical protein